MTQSAAINRRSRCGLLRGWPVLSWHLSPGAAPHVGQGIASICCGVSSFFIAEGQYRKPCGGVGTLAHRTFTIMIPRRVWALANVGESRPRCDEDNERG